ncbi:MAG: hypothetical protein ABSD80_00500 [Caulobacteraceae bacterium]
MRGPGRAVGCAALALAVCALWTRPAAASGDFTCMRSWKVAQASFSGCDDMAVMGPGNDTRVNLVLLMADLRGTGGKPLPPADGKSEDPLFDWASLNARLYPKPAAPDDGDFASGEGSRCLSNAGGATDFEAAVKAARGLTDAERTALLAARKALPADCTSNPSQPVTADVHSVAAKAFVTYLQGAEAFYGGNFDAAAEAFAALAKADDPWLRETARYMQARVQLNRLQVGLFDDYGALSKRAPADQVMAAKADFDAYLRAYPKGRYAASARGLERRLYWLGGMNGKLAAEYAAMAAVDPAARGLADPDLAQEIDNKLLDALKPADIADPTLLAVIDLKLMRAADSGSGDAGDQSLALSDLEAQRASFAGRQPLFDYLLAAHAIYVDHRPDEALRLIPDEAGQTSFTNLQFSRQMVRGLALEATKDPGAMAFWTRMLPGAAGPYQRPAVELAIAMHFERAAQLDKVFAAGSPVRSETMRTILLANAAGPGLLRARATATDADPHERRAALFALLYKEVTRSRYADFLKDAELIPADERAAPGPQSGAEPDPYRFYPSENDVSGDGPLWLFSGGGKLGEYSCPPLKETAARLARQSGDSTAKLCLAEFVRANELDGFFLDTPPAKDELGGAPSQFPGPAYARLEIYKQLIADPKTGAADKAYTLYRAVRCYAPSGNNHCGGEDVGQPMRKAWFERLKHDYPSSPWAKELKYYW